MVSDNAITGKLLNVSGYTAFDTGHAENQSGHFLALDFTANMGATIKTKVIGGSGNTTDLTSDKYCVYRITDNQGQQIEVVAEKDGKKTTKTYSLKGLTLAE